MFLYITPFFKSLSLSLNTRDGKWSEACKRKEKKNEALFFKQYEDVKEAAAYNNTGEPSHRGHGFFVSADCGSYQSASISSQLSQEHYRSCAATKALLEAFYIN